MFDWLSPTLLAAFTTAILVGGMVYFAVVFAPLVFRHLPSDRAGAFIRKVFPVYYLTGLVLSALAGFVAIWRRPTEGAILLLVAAGFAYSRQILMPQINALRDREATGDSEAGWRFRRLHRFSVLINMLQLLAGSIVLFGLMLAA